jgi:hypothetical protein
MAIQVIVSQKGPLPITASFNAPGNGPMYLEVNDRFGPNLQIK